MKISQAELDEGVKKHGMHLRCESGGEKLDLRWANLQEAYLQGANLQGADLREANLRWANLQEAYLQGADLRWANLREANLREANLREAYLRGADLQGANLRGADLRGADLRWAENLVEICKVDNLFTKILNAIESGGELDMLDWHNESCKTTHCMAGWAIHLAGEAGYLAERLLGPSCAGALIITQSCKYLSGVVPNFTASNAEGMEFIKECAEKEKAIV
jgi:uncharacterized protein YjbI with pentapeptide repeats